LLQVTRFFMILFSPCDALLEYQKHEDPLMQEIRYLDKLIDELAKGKAMERILRQ
jgi:hypothetical protein